MENANNISSDIMAKFKQIFTKQEEESFENLQIQTMSAINAFQENTYDDSAFRSTTSSYTRDKTCQINFTVLGVAIMQATKDNPNEVRLAHALSTLLKNLKELKEDLIIFLEKDPDSKRKETYMQALGYINKIIDLYPPELNQRQNMSI